MIRRMLLVTLFGVLVFTAAPPVASATPATSTCGLSLRFDDCTIDVSNIDDRR